MDENYSKFTKDMKKDHILLMPNMLPIHFKLIKKILDTAPSFSKPTERDSRSSDRNTFTTTPAIPRYL